MSLLETANHAQRERLAFIDFNLQYFGQVARADLIQRFQTGLAAATRDFSFYKECAPKNLVLKHQTKKYHRTNLFKPLFEHEPEAVLTGLCRGFGDGISHGVQPSQVCIDATRLVHPDAEVVSTVTRAITNHQPIKVNYVSLSSGESVRELVPHALINSGLRWHVRAFDRKHEEFRDFVLTRLVSIEVLDEPIAAQEAREADKQWNRIVDLHLIPHPELKHPKAIELDFDMVDGELTLEVRAALVGYLLNQWKVDCSKEYSLNSDEYQLALKANEAIYGVENLILAPGYN